MVTLRQKLLSDEHRQTISTTCLTSEDFQRTHRRPRTAAERAAISASRRVDKREDPEKWNQLYERALRRMEIVMQMEDAAKEIAQEEEELMETVRG